MGESILTLNFTKMDDKTRLMMNLTSTIGWQEGVPTMRNRAVP